MSINQDNFANDEGNMRQHKWEVSTFIPRWNNDTDGRALWTLLH